MTEDINQAQVMLFTRASPKLKIIEAWDKWQINKHMPDLVRGPGLLNASHYLPLAADTPQAFRAAARRAVVYRAAGLDEMRQWLASPELAEAVKDGSQWGDATDPLEDEWFTGNIYQLLARHGAKSPLASHILIERFEAKPEIAREFEAWLDKYARAMAALPGIEAARSFMAVRSVSNTLYLSRGNYALQTSIAPGQDVLRVISSPEAQALIARSQDWERRLSYLTREIFSPAGHAAK